MWITYLVNVSRETLSKNLSITTWWEISAKDFLPNQLVNILIVSRETLHYQFARKSSKWNLLHLEISLDIKTDSVSRETFLILEVICIWLRLAATVSRETNLARTYIDYEILSNVSRETLSDNLILNFWIISGKLENQNVCMN